MKTLESMKAENQYCIPVLARNLSYRDFLGLMDIRRIDYMVVGGMALIAHGMESRITRDLDVLHMPGRVSFEGLKEMMSRACHVERHEAERIGDPYSFIRVETADGQLDLSHHHHGIVFEDAYCRSEDLAVGDTRLRCMSLFDLHVARVVSYDVTKQEKRIGDIDWLRKQVYGV
jgi:hypothetical protein